MWGSLIINGPSLPSPSPGGISPLPTGSSPSPPSPESSGKSYNPNTLSPYVSDPKKGPAVSTWKIVLIVIGSVSCAALVMTGIVIALRIKTKAEQTLFVNEIPNNVTTSNDNATNDKTTNDNTTNDKTTNENTTNENTANDNTTNDNSNNDNSANV